MTRRPGLAGALDGVERFLLQSIAFWRHAVVRAGPEVVGTPSLSVAGTGAASGKARRLAGRGSRTAAARSRAVRARSIVGSGNG